MKNQLASSVRCFAVAALLSGWQTLGQTTQLSIGNTVWKDLNQDGKRQDGEPGVPGVWVNAFRDDGDGVFKPYGLDPFVGNSMTDADGHYRISGLSAGKYWLWVQGGNFGLGGALYGFTSSPGQAPADSDVDNDDSGQDSSNMSMDGAVSTLVTLSYGGEPDVPVDGDDTNSNSTVDFGFYLPPNPAILVVGDTIWRDLNGDGIRQPGEPGIPGVQVNAYRDNGDGVLQLNDPDKVVGYNFTDAEGRYRIGALSAGSYWVVVEGNNFNEGAALFGLASSPGFGLADSDADNDDSGQDNPQPKFGGIVSTLVTLSHGTEPDVAVDGDDTNSNSTVDFGFYLPPNPAILSTGNTVWKDLNGDGVLQPEEPGIPNVNVRAFRDNGDGLFQPYGPDPLAAETGTDAEGHYRLSGLSAGKYWVWIQGFNFNLGGPLYGLASSPGQAPADSDVDNDDSGQDSSNVAMDGAVSTLVTLSYGGEPDVPVDGDDPNTNSTVDFGFYLPPNPAILSVGDTIWKDLNHDGIRQVDEAGIPDVWVNAFRDDGDGVFNPYGLDPFVGNSRTDLEGHYRISGLSAGKYWLWVHAGNFGLGGALYGLASSPGQAPADSDLDNDDSGQDSSNVPMDGAVSTLVTLSYGGEPDVPVDGDDPNTNSTVDFGFYLPPYPAVLVVGNMIWRDLNGDGIREPGEPGIPGVQVNAYRDNGDGVLQLNDPDKVVGYNFTDAEGHYRIGALSAGSYWVVVEGNNFNEGAPLFGMSSSPGFGLADSDADNDDSGQDNPQPRLGGIVSTLVTLSHGTEPDVAVDGDDTNSNSTVDFGFMPPPFVVRYAVTLETLNWVEVVFSRAVSPASASDPRNYAIDGGVGVSKVTLEQNPARVLLTTTGLSQGVQYTLTVNNVQDQLIPPQTVAPNSRVTIRPTQGVLTRKAFLQISGSALSDLTSNWKFPSFPDEVTYPDLFETPTDAADHYGVQLAGYLFPPVTGDYVFFMSSDDQGALYLSMDDNPAHKSQIAFEPNWNPARAWVSTERRNPDTPENRSGPIHLEAGRRYYIEALSKEGEGGDNLGVTWQMPGEPLPFDGASPISGEFMSSLQVSGYVSFVQAPADQTVVELMPATFKVVPQGTPPYMIQWRRNGEPIPGANQLNYTIPSTSLDDNGAIFSVTIANLFSATTAAATLTVQADLTPPTINVATADDTFRRVILKFSEPVTPETAGDRANYSVSDGVFILKATPKPDGQYVELATTPLMEGVPYTVTVNNVTDRAKAHNPVAPNTQIRFTGWVRSRGFALHKFFGNIFGGIDTLTSDPRFPNDPSYENAVTEFEWPPQGGNDAGDYYGNQLSGWFIAPRSGDYIFYVASDDQSEVFLSTDKDPANKRQICFEPQWNPVRAYRTTDRRNPLAPENVSAPIPLQAGRRYYIEALHTEGSVTDNLAVAVQLPGGPTVQDGDAPIAGEYLEGYVNPDWTGPIWPTAGQLDPTTAPAGQDALTLTVTGYGFLNGATVLWNGSPRTTRFVNGMQLTATILASDLAVPESLQIALVTVVNPGGLSTEPLAFTITGHNVSQAQSDTVAPGETTIVSTAPSKPGAGGVTAVFTNGGASGSATITVANYNSNPTSVQVFDTGVIVDLRVQGADDGDMASVNFYYPAAVTGEMEANLGLVYFNGSAWADVLSSDGQPPLQDTSDNLHGTASGGLFAVIFDKTSTPRITELDGAVFAVAIADVTPPNITSALATPNLLWPPDHRLIPVTVKVTATDDTDPQVDCQVIAAISNEPDNGLGDGDTADDIQVTGPLTLNLRAERSGKGSGRIYTVTVRCVDDLGNWSTRDITILVPLDRKNK